MRWSRARTRAASSRRPARWALKSSTKPSSSGAPGAPGERALRKAAISMGTVTTGRAGVMIGKEALHQLRAVLERETGNEAALLVREIGFATGSAPFESFQAWVSEHYHVESPSDPDSRFLAEALSGFFAEAGWGPVTESELTPSVLALDMADWAEAEPRGTEFPSCHFSSGMFADFFTRLGGSQAAVMEVECLCRGEPRCRFLVGSPDVLTYVYERMTAGLGYRQAGGIWGVGGATVHRSSVLVRPIPVSRRPIAVTAHAVT